jgi:hypothetical protein
MTVEKLLNITERMLLTSFGIKQVGDLRHALRLNR